MATFSSRELDTVWRPEVLAYFRNTEFFHPAEEGRTRFGALVGLRRTFTMGTSRTAEVGGFVHQSFGAIPKFAPWVALRYQNDWSKVSFGSILERSHSLPRQLVNPDLRYAVPIVYGMSGTATGGGFRAQYWVEWLSAIDYGSPVKERIHGGAIAGWVGKRARLEGVLQYHHVGGQIDTSPEVDGNRLNYGLMGRINAGPLEVRAAHLRYADPLARFGPEKSGHGSSLEAQLRMGKRASLDASYWQAENFRAPLGQGLFQSRNPEDPMSWYRKDSQILGLGLGWEGSSSLRIRAWYDIAERSLQPSVTWVRYVVLDPMVATKHKTSQGR